MFLIGGLPSVRKALTQSSGHRTGVAGWEQRHGGFGAEWGHACSHCPLVCFEAFTFVQCFTLRPPRDSARKNWNFLGLGEHLWSTLENELFLPHFWSRARIFHYWSTCFQFYRPYYGRPCLLGARIHFPCCTESLRPSDSNLPSHCSFSCLHNIFITSPPMSAKSNLVLPNSWYGISMLFKQNVCGLMFITYLLFTIVIAYAY